MNAKILRAFSIEKGEESRVSLLLLQSFFIGIFIASYEVIACSLFVQIFEKEDTALAMVISGIAGIILVSLYSTLQRKIRFTSLSVINIFFVTVLALFLRLAFEFMGNASNALIFTIFLMIGPFAVVLVLGFWGSAGRLFTLRQGKRLNGLVDSGMIIGMILVSSLMPLLQWLFDDIRDILFISVASVAAAAIIQFIISSRFREQLIFEGQQEKEEEVSTTSNKIKWGQLFKDKFTRNFSLFVTLSMVSAFFIWLSFLDVANSNYKNEEVELTNFFGVFNAITLTFTLVIKTTLYSRVMKTYGVKITLLSIIALMVILVGAAVLVGFTFGSEKGTATNFVLFFLVISLIRMFSQSLKLGIENPAQKIFFQPLDRSYRYDAQAKIEGVVNEAAGIVAGLLLIVIFTYLGVIQAMVILIGILILWMITGFKLYSEYQNTLRSSLTKLQDKLTDATFSDDGVSKMIQENISDSNPDEVIYTLNLSKNIQPLLFEKSLFSLLLSADTPTKEYILKQIDENNIFAASEILKELIAQEGDTQLKQKAQNVIDSLSNKKGAASKPIDIQKLSKSRNAQDKELAVKLIVEAKEPIFENVLSDLSRDLNPNVRLALIKAVGELKLTELYPFLIDQLDIPKYRAAASSVLIDLGEEVIDALDQAFYKSGYSTPALTRIVKILGIIGGPKSVSNLTNKITYPDRGVVNQTLLSLRACNYKADETNRNRLHQIIETHIANVAWYYAAQQEINHSKVIPELLTSIESEIQNSLNSLYLLLSLAYDAQTISNIRENIEGGTSESISYAIELLDLVIIEDLKPKLFPLLEDNGMTEKLNQLRVHYPREDFDSYQVLIEILNRDYNYCSRWTKVCSMMSILKHKKAKPEPAIIANMFNPDRLLYQAAAKLIYTLDKDQYYSIAERIPPARRAELEKLFLSEDKKKRDLMYDEIQYLLNVEPFKGLPGNVVCSIVDHLQQVALDQNELILTKDQNTYGALVVVREGSLILSQGQEELMRFGPEDVLGAMFILDSDLPETSVRTETKSVIYFLPEDELNMLVYEHTEFAESLIKLVNKRLGRKKTSEVV